MRSTKLLGWVIENISFCVSDFRTWAISAPKESKSHKLISENCDAHLTFRVYRSTCYSEVQWFEQWFSNVCRNVKLEHSFLYSSDTHSNRIKIQEDSKKTESPSYYCTTSALRDNCVGNRWINEGHSMTNIVPWPHLLFFRAKRETANRYVQKSGTQKYKVDCIRREFAMLHIDVLWKANEDSFLHWCSLCT